MYVTTIVKLFDLENKQYLKIRDIKFRYTLLLSQDCKYVSWHQVKSVKQFFDFENKQYMEIRDIQFRYIFLLSLDGKYFLQPQVNSDKQLFDFEDKQQLKIRRHSISLHIFVIFGRQIFFMALAQVLIERYSMFLLRQKNKK